MRKANSCNARRSTQAVMVFSRCRTRRKCLRRRVRVSKQTRLVREEGEGGGLDRHPPPSGKDDRTSKKTKQTRRSVRPAFPPYFFFPYRTHRRARVPTADQAGSGSGAGEAEPDLSNTLAIFTRLANARLIHHSVLAYTALIRSQARSSFSFSSSILCLNSGGGRPATRGN